MCMWPYYNFCIHILLIDFSVPLVTTIVDLWLCDHTLLTFIISHTSMLCSGHIGLLLDVLSSHPDDPAPYLGAFALAFPFVLTPPTTTYFLITFLSLVIHPFIKQVCFPDSLIQNSTLSPSFSQYSFLCIYFYFHNLCSTHKWVKACWICWIYLLNEMFMCTQSTLWICVGSAFMNLTNYKLKTLKLQLNL